MGPIRCKHCKHAGSNGGCQSSFKDCKAWRLWFRERWENIRREGERLKNQRRDKE